MLAFMLPLGVIGPWQILVIVLVVILLFGGKKIPELMRGMGRGVKEFKDAVNKDYTAENINETVASKSESKDEQTK
jgi:sec-independent protein translocase protein TatA